MRKSYIRVNALETIAHILLRECIFRAYQVDCIINESMQNKMKLY